jgi:hypothetical protein
MARSKLEVVPVMLTMLAIPILEILMWEACLAMDMQIHAPKILLMFPSVPFLATGQARVPVLRTTLKLAMVLVTAIMPVDKTLP